MTEMPNSDPPFQYRHLPFSGLFALPAEQRHDELSPFVKHIRDAFREVSIWPNIRAGAPAGVLYHRDPNGDHHPVWKTGVEIPLGGREWTAILTAQQPDIRTLQQSWTAAIAWTPWQVGSVHMGVIGGDLATFNPGTTTKLRFTAPDDAHTLVRQGGLYLGTHDEQSGLGLSATLTTAPAPNGGRDVRGYIGAKLKF